MPLDLTPHAHGRAASPTLALNERILALQQQGRKIYHLGFGESRFPVHPLLAEALRQHAEAHSYPPVQGFAELRQAIASFYQREFGVQAAPEQVIVGPGSKSLLYALLQVLDGDVLLPCPAWVSYAPHARLAHKHVFWIDTALEDEYCLTAERLLAALASAQRAGQRPRILILNNPGNPTGVVYPAETLAELAEVARRHGLSVISDEVYALVNHGRRPHISIARYYPEGSVITGGLSKHLSLGGWRFGLALLPAGRPDLMRALIALASEVWSAVAAPVQHAATLAYGGAATLMEYVRSCAGVHAAATQALYGHLQAAGIPCAPPSGAFYLYPAFDRWAEVLRQRYQVASSDDLSALLLEQYGLATLPGRVFGNQPERLLLRLASSYVYAQHDAQAAQVLEAYRQARGEASFIDRACPALGEVGQRLMALAHELSGQ